VSSFKSVSIESDGRFIGTKVTDLESGAELRYISGMSIDFPVGGVVTAAIEVVAPTVKFAKADAEVQGRCPFCGTKEEDQPKEEPDVSTA
jgi:hypothetical protein